MGSILLKDFVNSEVCYSLDINSLTYDVVKGSEHNFAKTCGYAQIVKIGAFHRKKTFVAVYVCDYSLFLAVGSKLFDLTGIDMYLKKSRVSLFLKKLTVIKRDKPQISFSYYDPQRQEWPNDGDIFSMISKISSGYGEKLRIILLWTAKYSGRQVDQGLVNEIESKVNRITQVVADFIREPTIVNSA